MLTQFKAFIKLVLRFAFIFQFSFFYSHGLFYFFCSSLSHATRFVVGPCLHILCTLPSPVFVCTAHSFTKYTHSHTHTHRCAYAYTNNFFIANTHSFARLHTYPFLAFAPLPQPLHSGLMHMHCLLILPYVRFASLALLFSSLLYSLPQFFIYPMHTLSKSLCALQGHTRPNCERHRHPLVRHIGIETIRHGILHGPSTAADCLSVCGALWRICVDYHLLGRTTLHCSAPAPAPFSASPLPGNLWQYAVCCLCISPVGSVCVCLCGFVFVLCNIVAWF